jgi:hypothetical protein
MIVVTPGAFTRTVPELAAALHPADRAELAAAGVEVQHALAGCEIVEARDGGRLIAAFGLNWHDGWGVPWMLSTAHIERSLRHEVAAVALDVVNDWKTQADRMHNIVHAQNARAVRFVQWLGFHVDHTPIGPGGAFLLFSWERGHV